MPTFVGQTVYTAEALWAEQQELLPEQRWFFEGLAAGRCPFCDSRMTGGSHGGVVNCGVCGLTLYYVNPQTNQILIPALVDREAPAAWRAAARSRLQERRPALSFDLVCPDCGGPAFPQEGCRQCICCGWSLCS